MADGPNVAMCVRVVYGLFKGSSEFVRCVFYYCEACIWPCGVCVGGGSEL